MLHHSGRGAGFVEPCLPSPAKAPPSGPDWLHEIKHDGFRIMALRDARGVRLYTRNGNDFTKRFLLVVASVMALRGEWQEQKKLARLLDKWLDAWWTATDPVAGSAFSGAIRRTRGVKPGTPDELILYRGKFIAIELKSASGRCTPAQRAERKKILRARGQWWVCRSANAAMWALYKSGVRFRTIVHGDGTIEHWQTPRLPAWEVPRRDPAERRPLAPDVAAEHRETMRAWRERMRDRNLGGAGRWQP